MEKILVMFLLLYAVPLFAQGEKKTTLSLYAGYVLPVEGEEAIGALNNTKFKDGWDGGMNLGAGLGFVVSPTARIHIDLDYSSFSLNTEKYLDGRAGTVTGGGMSAINISAALQLMLSEIQNQITPYVKIGVGALGFSDLEIKASGSGFSENVTITRTAFVQDFSLLFGGGIIFPLNDKTNIMVEGRYVMGVGTSKSYLPIKAGICFTL